MEKTCKYCSEIKTLNDFRKNRLKCKDCEKKDGRQYRKSLNGQEKTKKWNEENKDKFAELKSNYHITNRDKINEAYRKKYYTDPVFKLHTLTRRRISLVIHKKQSTDLYIGCSSEHLKKWFDFCFSDVMTYENHGDVWHIDHVIPINKFDLTDENQRLICFNWKNLMPFLKKKNLTKNKNIDHEQILIHIKNLRNFNVQEEFIQLYAKHLISGKSLIA
jgi:hypothetical protein